MQFDLSNTLKYKKKTLGSAIVWDDRLLLLDIKICKNNVLAMSERKYKEKLCDGVTGSKG